MAQAGGKLRSGGEGSIEKGPFWNGTLLVKFSRSTERPFRNVGQSTQDRCFFGIYYRKPYFPRQKTNLEFTPHLASSFSTHVTGAYGRKTPYGE